MHSTVLRAAIECKQYIEITVESGTHVKSVKITLNIFAVQREKIKLSFIEQTKYCRLFFNQHYYN